MILDKYTGLKMDYNATKVFFLYLKIVSSDTSFIKDGTKIKYKLPYNINLSLPVPSLIVCSFSAVYVLW